LKHARRFAPTLSGILLFWIGACAAPAVEAQSDLNAETYAAHHGGALAPAGQLEIDGRRMSCGQRPTVLDPDYDDFGGSYPGFLVLNPQRFGGLPASVKLWIYSHECAHQTVGSDEAKADCVAVQRGRREGWLTKTGLEQICEFIRPAGQDRQHSNGVKRCELMQQCLREDSKSSHR
jgi:hypothetical protein